MERCPLTLAIFSTVNAEHVMLEHTTAVIYRRFTDGGYYIRLRHYRLPVVFTGRGFRLEVTATRLRHIVESITRGQIHYE